MNRFNEILEKIDKDDKGKFDGVFGLNCLRMKNGRLNFEGDDEGHDMSRFKNLELNDWAGQQVCNKIKIPHKYFSRCPNSLKDQNVNEWLPESEDRVRMRVKGNVIRGFVSEKYVPLDNKPLVDILAELLDNREIDIKKFDVSERSMHCRIAFPDLATDVGINGKKDMLHVGVHIQNSEVGSSAVHVYGMVYREICTNGLIADAGGEELLNQRHIHIKTYELKNRAAEAIGNAAKVGSDVIERLINAQSEAVIDPMDVIKKLAKDKFTDKFTDEVLSTFQTEPQATKYGIVNAFTSAAKTLIMDRRVEVERFAGNLLSKNL